MRLALTSAYMNNTADIQADIKEAICTISTCTTHGDIQGIQARCRALHTIPRSLIHQSPIGHSPLMQQLEYEDASGTATLITAVYQYVAVMVAEGPQDETALQHLTLRWKQASSVLTGKEIIRQEQALWDQISMIMEQHDGFLCNREERISNLFLHQPAALRTYFDDALRYNNEKWRLLRWDSITEYYITAHTRYTAEAKTGTTGTPPGQDKPGQKPQGK